MHLRCVARRSTVVTRFAHCASPRHVLSQSCCHQHTPVCTRFARLDWGYEKFSLFEAVRLWQECRLFNPGSKLKAKACPKRYLHDQNQPSRSVKHRNRRLIWNRGSIAVQTACDCGGIAKTVKHFLLQQGRAFAVRGGAILTTNN